MANRIAVVISQGQSRNPAKRQLEDDLVTALIFEAGLDVTVIPNLYDLAKDGTGMLAMQGVKGPMVVVSWLYSRAAHWVLDRNNIHGDVGPILLTSGEEDETDQQRDVKDDKDRVIRQRGTPDRKIYCLDFRASESVDDFVVEIKRIAAEASTKIVSIGELGVYPKVDQQSETEFPTTDSSLNQAVDDAAKPANGDTSGNAAVRVEEQAGRRWYPVIDYSLCTNCMECIDFCLFGVYGVDEAENILVELPDNCRKGCPACSRVCPENAIIFPQHKTPAIAGAPAGEGALKIDLSMLFGKPDSLVAAANERDEQLELSGRDAVGMTVGMPKRQADTSRQDKDELDDLIDELDEADL
jgi:NAD-dependent dihydropyrimidine dehydrogenase PreA subunit